MTDQKATETKAIDTKAHRITLLQQTPLLVVLVVLWMLLWGSLTPLTIVTGIVLAFGVTRVFYLPAVELSGRFHPFWFLVFLGRFFGELVVASFQVAAQAFAPRGVTSNAVIGVQLATRSDFIMTITAIALSLIPGSIVVEADRARGILYLHTLGVTSAAEVEKARDNALLTEARLVQAFGSRDDMDRVKP
ncbi:Na+/H+ antiporter subunit E [Glaciihabitans arcticus]|uniref:Na+/H+ antiporter subunit E n=1 Tax=Glaciihabitans arcticus TaxID=2668039 RepID=A0A4Q9GMN7_9MICO|nr:Na+/H+ antiporter subunit E [Glaciihabitans arcticus]TBN56042.1 Na+/H+ antiporter subunit E [Glaciihabitans arcticus]